MMAFRKDEVLWFRVAENTFDNFNGAPCRRQGQAETESAAKEKPRRATGGAFLLHARKRRYLKTGGGHVVGWAGRQMSILTLLGSTVDGASRK